MAITRRDATRGLIIGGGWALAGGNCSQPPPTGPTTPPTGPTTPPTNPPTQPPIEPPTQPPSTGLRTRRDATGMGANDPVMVAYGNAVQAMKALPSSDRRSWTNQMQTHLSFCPHGNWWFLPWHRAYLHSFEEICREMIGDNSFALPYWNWSRNGQLPPAFRDPSSPLFHPGRLSGNRSVPAELVSAQTIQQQILSETNFELFGSGRSATQRGQSSQGPLEAQPHNGVHGFVGGDMQTFQSPLDPIFWLHHANVDRIWSIWSGRGNANPSDNLWRGQSYGEFVSRSGSSINVSTASVVNTQALGYQYDGNAVTQGMGLREPFARFRATTQGDESLELAETVNTAKVVLKSTNPTRCIPNQVHELKVTTSNPRRLENVFGEPEPALPVEALRNPDRVIARIGDMESPQNQNVIVRVFVNCDYLTSSTPTSDPSYAGSFGFFCGEGSDCLTGDLATTKDITAALRQVQGADYTAEDVRVQLMPVALDGRSLDNADFYARSIEIATV